MLPYNILTCFTVAVGLESLKDEQKSAAPDSVAFKNSFMLEHTTAYCYRNCLNE